MGRVRDVLALVVWTVALVATEVGLLAAIQTLDPPGGHDAGAWAAWFESAPPEEVVVAFGAVAAAATGAYLVVATVAATAASLAGASPARAVRRCLPAPLVHRLARRAVGAGLAASVAIGPVAPVAAADHVAGATGGSGPVPALPWLERAGTPPPGAGTPPPETSTAPGPVGPAPAREPERPRPHDDPTGWTVAPGDHFWSIAERVLAAAWGRQPHDRELVPYWRTLIDANLDRLVVPGEPDLILPGQQLVVPAPPAAPR